MDIPKTKLDLQGFIDNRVSESSALDYKAAASLLPHLPGKKDIALELTKDVSALANADGGMIIYPRDRREILAPLEFTPVQYSQQPTIDHVEVALFADSMPRKKYSFTIEECIAGTAFASDPRG